MQNKRHLLRLSTGIRHLPFRIQVALWKGRWLLFGVLVLLVMAWMTRYSIVGRDRYVVLRYDRWTGKTEYTPVEVPKRSSRESALSGSSDVSHPPYAAWSEQIDTLGYTILITIFVVEVLAICLWVFRSSRKTS